MKKERAGVPKCRFVVADNSMVKRGSSVYSVASTANCEQYNEKQKRSLELQVRNEFCLMKDHLFSKRSSVDDMRTRAGLREDLIGYLNIRIACLPTINAFR